MTRVANAMDLDPMARACKAVYQAHLDNFQGLMIRKPFEDLDARSKAYGEALVRAVLDASASRASP